MRSDKEVALKLRLSGKSYTEIQRTFGIPKSTLSGWFSNLQLSDHLRQKILARGRKKSTAALVQRNRNQTTLAIKRKIDTQRAAKKEVPPITKDALFFLGTSLYWAEGYKRPQVRNGRELTSHAVSLTNSDPALVRIFLRFLRETCNVPESKIRADIRIYEHQNGQHLLGYWLQITKISKENFGKTYYGVSKSSIGKRPYNRLPYGTIQIRVNDTKLFHRIMGWIEGVKKRAIAD